MQSNRRNSLEAFFEPGAVAIFGSLREWGGLGRGVIQNLFDFGFEGQIYPVNLSYSEVMGLKVYPAVYDVEDSVDLAVVITPPTTVPGIIEQCAEKGIKAAVVVSENFAEADEDGARLQAQLSEIALRRGIRVMGPNTVGILNTANGLVTIPYLVGYEGVQKGSVGYCSQSGIAAAQCQPLEDRGYPVSKMCDIGNKCDVDEVDIMNYMADDPETKALAMHLEDIKDGRRFMDAARNLASRKPLLIFKSGRSEAGARASASHTGSLKGNDRIYSDAFKQAGAMRLNSWQEFWDIPKVFASRPLPVRNRIAIITHSGASGLSLNGWRLSQLVMYGSEMTIVGVL